MLLLGNVRFHGLQIAGNSQINHLKNRGLRRTEKCADTNENPAFAGVSITVGTRYRHICRLSATNGERQRASASVSERQRASASVDYVKSRCERKTFEHLRSRTTMPEKGSQLWVKSRHVHRISHVCFTPISDRESEFPHKVMSALPSKADMCSAIAHVCFGPKADIGGRAPVEATSSP